MSLYLGIGRQPYRRLTPKTTSSSPHGFLYSPSTISQSPSSGLHSLPSYLSWEHELSCDANPRLNPHSSTELFTLSSSPFCYSPNLRPLSRLSHFVDARKEGPCSLRPSGVEHATSCCSVVRLISSACVSRIRRIRRGSTAKAMDEWI